MVKWRNAAMRRGVETPTPLSPLPPRLGETTKGLNNWGNYRIRDTREKEGHWEKRNDARFGKTEPQSRARGASKMSTRLKPLAKKPQKKKGAEETQKIGNDGTEKTTTVIREIREMSEIRRAPSPITRRVEMLTPPGARLPWGKQSQGLRNSGN